MKTLAFFFALVTSFVFAAEPIKMPSLTVNGREYKETSITNLDGRLARVVHESGAARIPMELLPVDLRKQLGFDEVAAAASAEYQRKVAEEEADRIAVAARVSKIIKRAKDMTVKVLSITETGLLCTWGDETIFMEAQTKGAGYLSDYSYKFRACEMGSFSYTTVLGADRTVKRFADLRTYDVK